MTTHGVSVNTLPSGGGGIGSGGSGGSPLEVQDEGVTVDLNTTLLDFVGAGVTASPTGAGQVQVNVPGPVGHWAGVIPAASFAGSPLKATVTFPSAHPSGLNYSIAALEGVVIGSGLSLDISYENKTANGFDVVINTAGPLPNLIQVDWQVQPHSAATGTFGQISLPGIQDFIVVDKGSNVTENGSQQFPFHTVQAAINAAVSGDVILVYPGTYTEQITPKSGITIHGVDKTLCKIVSPAPATPTIASVPSVGFTLRNVFVQSVGSIIQTAVSQGVIFQDCTLLGLVQLAGASSAVSIVDGSLLVGSVDVAEDATALLDDSQISGSPSGTPTPHPVTISHVDAKMIVKRSKLYGGKFGYPIYWNVDGGTAWCAYSIMYGPTETYPPFGAAGGIVGPILYRTHHCTYGDDPEGSGIWVNEIAPGQRYDCMDQYGVY